jgi:hypothetical protein
MDLSLEAKKMKGIGDHAWERLQAIPTMIIIVSVPTYPSIYL